MTTEAERGVTWPQAKDTWTHQPQGKAGRSLPAEAWRRDSWCLDGESTRPACMVARP